MGHANISNISKHIAYMLIEAYSDHEYDEYGDVTCSKWNGKQLQKPVTVKQVIDHMKLHLDLLLKELDNIKDPHAKKHLKELIEEEWSLNASEGSYYDEYMIGMGVEEVFFRAEEMKWVRRDEKDYYLTKPEHFEDILKIDYMEN